MGARYDVVIAGGGPAGALLAYHLAQAGLAVTILEKKQFPRTKPCGGGVTPKTRRLIPFSIDGVVEDVITSGSIRYRDTLDLTWTEPVCYMVTRRRFDEFLLGAAARAGAEVRTGVAVTGAEGHPDGVYIHSTGGTYRAEVVAVADGANSRLARMVRPQGKRGLAISCRVTADHARLMTQRGRLGIDLSAVPGGYGWIFPKGDHLNVGIGTVYPGVRNLRALLDAYLAREGLITGTTAQIQGHPLPFEGLAGGRVTSVRTLLLGDAAGLVDPFTGEGIHNACLSACLAAEAIVARRRRPAEAVEVYQKLVKDNILKELKRAYWWGRVFYRYADYAMRFLEKRPVLARELWGILFRGNYRDIWGCVGRYFLRTFKAV
ncbi:MAG: geranylgeranyl reductase family protein [Desulfotomaculales bacterium]